MNANRRLAFLLGLVSLLSFPRIVIADIVSGESIEWVVADSGWVFTGKVVKVEDVGGESEDSLNATYEVATVEVSKTYKGRHKPKATFLVRRCLGPVARGWLKSGLPYLFCLEAADRAPDRKNLPLGFQWLLRFGGNQHSAFHLGKPKEEDFRASEVLTCEFEVLAEQAAILKRIGEAVRAIPSGWKKRCYYVEVTSHTPAWEKLDGGSSVYLAVPVHGMLEALGRSMCRSKDCSPRAEGAKILGLFKNETNLKILTSMLADTVFSIEGDKQGEKRVYESRKAAYRSLRALGEKVDRPLLEEIPGEEKLDKK
jgi:hypothetical protein